MTSNKHRPPQPHLSVSSPAIGLAFSFPKIYHPYLHPCRMKMSAHCEECFYIQLFINIRDLRIVMHVFREDHLVLDS